MEDINFGFSEEEYYSWYKRIRNKFRKYNSVDVLNACINYLYKPEKDKIAELQKLPWLVLLLIKWVLIDAEFSTKHKKPLDEKSFIDLLQLMRDMGSKARLPSQFENTNLFMRCMANQQLMYQHEFSLSYLARQVIFFGCLPDNHYINVTFKSETGMSIIVFLELVLVTLTRFITKNTSTISSNWFGSLKSHYSDKCVNDYLSAISISLTELRKELLKSEGNKRRSQEYWEQTPLLEYPLVDNDGTFLSFLPVVLYRSMENYIYDKMRKVDAAKFMDKFGEIFERYIDNSIAYTGLKYIKEQDIVNLLGHKGNLIDFVILESDANIYIDAKATEMSYSGKVAHLSQVLKDKTKKSILKAIKQAHDVVNKISDNKSQLDKDDNYLIVVTFKDMYLGNGITFYETVAKDKMDEIFNEYSGKKIIAPEDMYFISIEQFDILSELVQKNLITFKSAIETAKNADSKPETRKFDFWLHMASWGHPLDIPSFLTDEGDRMFSKLGTMLQPTANRNRQLLK